MDRQNRITRKIHNKVADHVKKYNEHPDIILLSPDIIDSVTTAITAMGEMIIRSVGCELVIYYHSDPAKRNYIAVGKFKSSY
jgi:hypothetical protein